MRFSLRSFVAGAVVTGALLLGLSACASGPALEDYVDDGPTFQPEVFFEGDLTAWGVFQDRFGEVRRRFVVDVVGEWDGETLTLLEDFVYEDGTEERRIWRLRKTGATTWEGEAEGVVGVATGEVAGNAFNFAYTFDLTLPDGDTLRVDFDDWLWQQDDQVVVNRAYVSKFGFEIGQLSIFFKRDEPLPAQGS